MSILNELLARVRAERERQDAKWGPVPQCPDLNPKVDRFYGPRQPWAHAIDLDILEASAAKHATSTAARNGELGYGQILVEEVCETVEAAALRNDKELTTELVQVAAVALAWAEAVEVRSVPSMSADRGVAGDRCEAGNACGRLGCPECQA